MPLSSGRATASGGIGAFGATPGCPVRFPIRRPGRGCLPATRSSSRLEGPSCATGTSFASSRLDRAIHVVVLSTSGRRAVPVRPSRCLAASGLRRHHERPHGGNPGESQVRGVLGYLGKAFEYSPQRLIQLGLGGHRLCRARGHRDGRPLVRQAVGRVPDLRGHHPVRSRSRSTSSPSG